MAIKPTNIGNKTIKHIDIIAKVEPFICKNIIILNIFIFKLNKKQSKTSQQISLIILQKCQI